MQADSTDVKSGEDSIDSNTAKISEPVQIKGIALKVIAAIFILYALNWAQSLIVTILFGILISFTLNPVVKWLEIIKIPRPIGSSLIILLLIFTILGAIYSLSGQVQSIISKVPIIATKLNSKLTDHSNKSLMNVKEIQIAAIAVEKATSAVDNHEPKTKKTPVHVVVDEPSFQIKDYLLIGTKGIVKIMGESIMIIIMAYFSLLSGDSFKRKIVKLTGPTLAKRRITVQILDDINNLIQKYLFMLLITNALVGILSWGLFRLMGLDNAGAWALGVAFLHLIPYFGPMSAAAALGLAAYMQFASITSVLLIVAVFLTITGFVGVFVATWMTGRIAKMNMVAVFVSLLFWSWLWGIWGMLLGTPIVVIIKVVFERIENLKPFAELLGE